MTPSELGKQVFRSLNTSLSHSSAVGNNRSHGGRQVSWGNLIKTKIVDI